MSCGILSSAHQKWYSTYINTHLFRIKVGINICKGRLHDKKKVAVLLDFVETGDNTTKFSWVR